MYIRSYLLLPLLLMSSLIIGYPLKLTIGSGNNKQEHSFDANPDLTLWDIMLIAEDRFGIGASDIKLFLIHTKGGSLFLPSFTVHGTTLQQNHNPDTIGIAKIDPSEKGSDAYQQYKKQPTTSSSASTASTSTAAAAKK